VGGLAALREEPGEMTLTLPDGRRMQAMAGALALRFAREGGRWQPQALHGVRARAVTLAGRRLIAGDELRERVDVLIGAE
jgi:hypothetical protein